MIPGPRLTLILLLALAAILAGGGFHLSRREKVIREERPVEPLQESAAALRTELDRLQGLFEGHLRRIARLASEGKNRVQREAEQLRGVRAVSVLVPPGTGVPASRPDWHVQVAGEPVLLPAFEQDGRGARLVLDPDEILRLGGESGWIDQPGKPLLFWVRGLAGSAVVFTLDAAELQSAVQKHLRSSWDGPLLRNSGADQLRNRNGALVYSSGPVPQAAPDIRLEVGGHLGHWEFAAWDKRWVELHHDTETLMGTTGLAVFIAVLALGLYGHQRRTQLEAERRVTFVNRVSHELRSPLTNILLHLDLAAELSDEESSGARRSLGLVREEANRLARLIQNVLTFSRREHGRQPGRTSVCVPDTVVSQVLEGFAAAFLRRGIRVGTHLNANSACLIDADALAQILGNLFSNAEKYAPHSEVCVRSEWQRGHLKLHVADTGPGIPVEAAARVFEPFERLNDRLTEGVSGTGLGLAIAQDLTEGMGGSLRLETGGEGARFVLEIPAPPAPALEVVG